MLNDRNPTTRCFPRTTDEAFPNKVERAEWFYPPQRSLYTRHIVLGCIGIAMWIGLGVFLLKA